LNVCAHNLLLEVGTDPEELAFPNGARMLLDTLHMFWELNRGTTLPHFESIAALREHHDNLAAEYTRILQERENQRAARRVRRRVEPQEGKTKREPIRAFPQPPLPGTADIVPLTSEAFLLAEGRGQHNCVGSYCNKVRGGSTYIYKVLRPQRATLSIVRGADGAWRIDELKAAHNVSVRRETRAAVSRWLYLQSMSA
jgi:hypothetical protein